jgi:hypothetical protein
MVTGGTQQICGGLTFISVYNNTDPSFVANGSNANSAGNIPQYLPIAPRAPTGVCYSTACTIRIRTSYASATTTNTTTTTTAKKKQLRTKSGSGYELGTNKPYGAPGPIRLLPMSQTLVPSSPDAGRRHVKAQSTGGVNVVKMASTCRSIWHGHWSFYWEISGFTRPTHAHMASALLPVPSYTTPVLPATNIKHSSASICIYQS